MKIAMIGLGAVAMADALALGRVHDVVLTGPLPDRVDAIARGDYGLDDPGLDDYLRAHAPRVEATLDTRAALAGAQLVLVSAPLSHDPETGALRIVELESRIELAARELPLAPIVIRSAVPIGFTDGLRQRLGGAKLVYAPEFARAGRPLGDRLHAGFVLVGDRGHLGAQVADVLADAALNGAVARCFLSPSEAEALRHLSVLVQSPDESTLARPFDYAQRHARRHDLHIREMAIHVHQHGAARLGVYLDPTEDGAPLEAFGMRTHRPDARMADLAQFKESCNLVVARALTPDLADIRYKVLTRAAPAQAPTGMQ